MKNSIQRLAANANWREFSDAPGVEYQTLRKHESGGLTLMLRFAPGSAYHAHRHPGGEEYFVVDGALEDLGKSWPKGSYLWHEPGSTHRPSSKSGAIVLVFLPEAIERLKNAGV